MGACSEDSNPLTSDAGTNVDQDEGVTDLTFITRPQTKEGLAKIITDSKYIYKNQGGQLNLASGNDFQLIEMIKKAPYWGVTTYDLALELLNASPLSAKVLESICDNIYLRDDYWMIQVFLRNSPMRKNVLDKLIANNFITQNQTYWMKEVLVASSPLPQNIMNQIYYIPLQPSERYEVFAAQVGQRQDELYYNNAGGGLEIKLTVQNYSILEDTYISMTTDDAFLMGDVYLTFGPHGTTFNPPALLDVKVSNLDLTGIDPDLVNIYYDNQETGTWELMPSKKIVVDVEAGYLEVEEAQFSHFSRYAIGMR
jgi:hypothetical protein